MSTISPPPPPPPPISTSTPHRLLHPPPNSDTKPSDRHARLLSKLPHTFDEFALAGLLKASRTLLPDPRLARQLHPKSIRAGLSLDSGVRTSLVAAYSALDDSLCSSRALFDELPPALNTDVPTWNSMISAYARHGCHEESLRLFSSMLGNAHLVPTDATYIVLIGSCASTKDIDTGKTLHGRIVKLRNMVDELKLQNCLITFYAKCARLGDARKVFDATIGSSGSTNVVTWNAMIAGYGQNGECQLALTCSVGSPLTPAPPRL